MKRAPHRRHTYWAYLTVGSRQRFDRLVRQLKITPEQLRLLKRKERAS